MPSEVKSSTLLFAGDIKIWGTVHSISDGITIQDDPHSLVRWTGRRPLEVNSHKGVVVQLNNHNDSFHYTICGVVLL